MKDQLVFNPAAAADTDTVGAYTLDGAGNAIPSQTIAATAWLQVASALFDGSGNALTSTGAALDINIKSGTLDVGVADKTTFTYGTTVEQPVGGVYQDTSPALTAGQTGAARLTANRAWHMNLRDAAGAELVGQKAMAASVPVVFASDQSAITTNDAALANTAILESAGSVTAVAAALIASALAGRKYLKIQNDGTVPLWVGSATVTTATGTKIPPGGAELFRCGASVSPFAVTAAATTADVRLLELS